jgi:hypothetical protein
MYQYQYPYHGDQSWPDPGSLEPADRRRRSAPAVVHVVAALHYLVGGAVLAIAGYGAWIGWQLTLHDTLEDPPRFVGIVIAVAVAGAGIVVLGRRLQRGGQVARVVAIALHLVAASALLYWGWAAGTPWPAIGLVVPVLVLTLCATPAARSWFRRSA